MEDSERQRKNWFYVHDDKVGEGEGFSCAPDNPTTWWMPEVGYSMSEKHHLFETRGEARQVAIEILQKKIKNLQASLAKLQSE